MIEAEKLIPDLIEWRKLNGQNFSIESWTSIEGNMNLAIGFSFIFWPDFIEHNDCVFIKNHFSISNFDNWTKTACVNNYAQIESVMNHIHILDLFSREEIRNIITIDQVKFLGKKICEMYSVKLKSDFPERQFTFTFNCDKDLELDEYEITFYQKNNESKKI